MSYVELKLIMHFGRPRKRDDPTNGYDYMPLV